MDDDYRSDGDDLYDDYHYNAQESLQNDFIEIGNHFEENENDNDDTNHKFWENNDNDFENVYEEPPTETEKDSRDKWMELENVTEEIIIDHEEQTWEIFKHQIDKSVQNIAQKIWLNKAHHWRSKVEKKKLTTGRYLCCVFHHHTSTS
mmetsp:Transcript_38802/g.51126  ORF Transcript_38802/g.51126 Transcript_38802/m.51126 type:complete len:148 (-) Transcript_38802:238-681(-)